MSDPNAASSNGGENNAEPNNAAPNNEGENHAEPDNAIPKTEGENNATLNDQEEELKKEISLLNEEKEKLKNELNKIKEEKEQLENKKESINNEILLLHQNKETLEKEIHDQVNYFQEKLKNCKENEQSFMKDIEQFILKLQSKEQQNEEEQQQIDTSDDNSNNNDIQMSDEEKQAKLTELIENKDYNYPAKQMDDLLKGKKSINPISDYIINYITYQIDLEQKNGKKRNPCFILQNFEHINDETMHKLLKIPNFSPFNLSVPYLMSVLERLFSYKNLLKDSKNIVLTNTKLSATPKEMKRTKNCVKDLNTLIINIENALEKKVSIEGIESLDHNMAESLNIEHLVIGSSVTTIEAKSFYRCYKLKLIEFLDNNVAKIGSSAFAYCKNLSNFIVPNKVVKIESRCFDKCENLVSIVLHEGITEIEEKAFNKCQKLENFDVPKSVTQIGKGALKKCINLQSIHIPGVLLCKDNIAENEPNDEPVASFTIPTNFASGCEKIISMKIMKLSESLTIENNAFANCSSLQSLFFDVSKTTKIGISAFQKCDLKKVDFNINQDSSLEIGEHSFNNCEKLTNVNFINPDSLLENGLEIKNGAFKDCFLLEEINIPNKIKGEIGEGSFQGCGKLNKVTLPTSITKISKFLFRGDKQLKDISFPEANITTIEEGGFEGCSNLDIKIPSKITKIDKNGFKGCENMKFQKPSKEEENQLITKLPEEIKEVINSLNEDEKNKFIIYQFPETLTEIGDYSFMGCSSLAADVLIIPKSINKIGKRAFVNCPIKYVVVKNPEIEMQYGSFYLCKELVLAFFPEKIESKWVSSFNECCDHFDTRIDTSEDLNQQEQK